VEHCESFVKDSLEVKSNRFVLEGGETVVKVSIIGGKP